MGGTRRCGGLSRSPSVRADRMPTLKLATFNINNIGKRLAVLLEWLTKASPDIVCLQEIKVADTRFPLRAIEAAGYGARWVGQPSWNGVAILAKGMTPVETRRQLPGDPSDTQSRYLEAAAHGVLVGCLYAPNGNPQPGPKFAYKLAWMHRLLAHAQALYETGHPVALVGDYNVVPSSTCRLDQRTTGGRLPWKPRNEAPRLPAFHREGLLPSVPQE